MISHDIGAYIKTLKAFKASNASAGAINGAAIDRNDSSGGMALSCELHLACGDATGSPTAQSADLKLQESADGSTGWADITGAAVTQLTGDDEQSRVSVDLSGSKRYIRAVCTVAFTGGTTPAIPVAGVVALGGFANLPA